MGCMNIAESTRQYFHVIKSWHSTNTALYYSLIQPHTGHSRKLLKVRRKFRLIEKRNHILCNVLQAF